MEKLQRKVTYRLYPSASQEALMEETLALHCRVYNTLLEEHQRRHGQVRLSGIGLVPMRGQGRFSGTPKTSEVIHKSGKWYLSATYTVAPEAIARKRGSEAAAFDWGLTTLLTIARADGTLETIDNPRWLKKKLEAIKALQRAISEAETQAKVLAGIAENEPLQRGQRFPVTPRLKRLYAQLRAIHAKVSRQRHDFYHQLTKRMVEQFAFLGTEELAVKNMSKAPRAKPDPEKPGAFLRQRRGGESRPESWHPGCRACHAARDAQDQSGRSWVLVR